MCKLSNRIVYMSFDTLIVICNNNISTLVKNLIRRKGCTLLRIRFFLFVNRTFSLPITYNEGGTAKQYDIIRIP